MKGPTKGPPWAGAAEALAPRVQGTEARRGRGDDTSGANKPGTHRPAVHKPGGTGLGATNPSREAALARTCVGCRQPGTRDSLLRLVAGEDGRVVIDPRARAGGRGAWVHASRDCVLAAVKRHAAERTLKVDVQRDLEGAALLADLRAALSRKVTSLLLVAARKRQAAVGADAVAASLETTRVALVLVAADAGEAARAIAGESTGTGSGPGTRVIRFLTKTELGSVFHRGEVALVALLDLRVAAELASTIDRLAGLEDR